MRMDVIDRNFASASFPSGAPPFIYEDPLDHDAPEDAYMATTRRELLRLALISAETGARFQREGIAHDPMAWLLAPRRLFDGASAIDACLSREACIRALLVHGLGLGLDADPVEVDALGGDDDAGEDHEFRKNEMPEEEGPAKSHDADPTGRRLYTFVFVEERDGQRIYAFGAMIEPDAEAAVNRLRGRYGDDYADNAVLQDGFDAGSPLATTLLSGAIMDMLSQIASDPMSPLADGLEVMVEQRFAL